MHSKLTLAREIAYDAFVDVMEKKMSPEAATEAHIQKCQKPLRKIDRNLIKEILYGSLRWYSKIYWIIQNTADRDLDKTTPQLRACLVLGTYQIFYMDRVPDRAAVNESVEYIRKKGQANAVKFVNGILRSIARRAEYFAKPDKDKQPVEYLSLQFAHPKWIVERWHSRFKFDRTKAILTANNHPPPFTIRVNSQKQDLESIQEFRSEILRREKIHTERKSIRCGLSLKESPPLEEGSMFAEGWYSVQDEASQIIGYLVAPQEGEVIIDACCAPGGKLGHLYELSHGKAVLYAVDVSEQKLARVKSNWQRLGFTDPHWVTADFLQFTPEQVPQKILLDAPCSGLGVLRRHPEGKWHKKQDIVAVCAEKQRALIDHALRCLPAGGELIYSVCSFETEETLDQLDWIRSNFGDRIEVISAASRIPDYYKRFVTREDCLLIFSGNKDRMDGFGAFIIRVKEPLN